MVRREAHRAEVGLEGLYDRQYFNGGGRAGVETVCDGPLAIEADALEVKWLFHGCTAEDEEALIASARSRPSSRDPARNGDPFSQREPISPA